MMSFRPFAFGTGRPSTSGNQSAKVWSRRFVACSPVVMSFTFLMGTRFLGTCDHKFVTAPDGYLHNCTCAASCFPDLRYRDCCSCMDLRINRPFGSQAALLAWP